MKTCTKCGVSKGRTEFQRDRQKKDGLRPSCKECSRKRDRHRYWADPVPARERNAKYRKANPDKIRERAAAYYVNNAEAVKARAARFREENPERVRATKALYYQEHHAAIQEYRRQNADRIRENRARSYRENPVLALLRSARYRARKRAARVEPFTTAELYVAWEDAGMYACVACGAPWEHVDHIVPLARGGAHSIDNLQPLCAACNLSKSARDPWEWARDLMRGASS
ncbi:HNH endonuclease [Streptomyces sirii]|uniref:HNH endonuclease n=1 Tax=Streptomyces sirii TaxID=3127701 RepID=UPI003D36B60A